MVPLPTNLITTSVVGSYAFPGWLCQADEAIQRGEFGAHDVQELVRDAVTIAVLDQERAGVDIITDGEMGRLDFNLGFYSHLSGIEPLPPERKLGAPGHDQRGKYRVTGPLEAPRGLGVIDEYRCLKSIATHRTKATCPGPYTLAGRLAPNAAYPDRMALTEALIPIVRQELQGLVAEGCDFVQLDEPSFAVYPERIATYVDLFNRTIAGIDAKIATHLCFGNYRARAVGKRSYRPLLPHVLEMKADQFILEFASRELAEIELCAEFARVGREVAVGMVDVKSYYIESPEDIAERVRLALQYVPPQKLTVLPDCGFSQTARWAAYRKLTNMVQGVEMVRRELTGEPPTPARQASKTRSAAQ